MADPGNQDADPGDHDGPTRARVHRFARRDGDRLRPRVDYPAGGGTGEPAEAPSPEALTAHFGHGDPQPLTTRRVGPPESRRRPRTESAPRVDAPPSNDS